MISGQKISTSLPNLLNDCPRMRKIFNHLCSRIIVLDKSDNGHNDYLIASNSFGVDVVKSNKKFGSLTKEFPKTDVIRDDDVISGLIVNIPFATEKTFDVCMDANGPSVIMGVLPIENIYFELRKKEVFVRFITEITKENVWNIVNNY